MIQTHNLCDTGAVLYQLSYQAKWELVALWVRDIPVDGDTSEYMKDQIYFNCVKTIWRHKWLAW